MRGILISSLALAGLLVASAACAEPMLQIQDAAIRVTVIPEARGDVQVTVTHANPRLPIVVTREGDHMVVRGRVPRLATSCWGAGAVTGVTIGMIVPVRTADLPQIVVHAPRDAVIQVSHGAAFGQVGPSQSLRLGNSSCGSWTVGDIAGRLAVINAGSADIRAGSAARAEVTLQGSGDLVIGRVSGSVTARLMGSGDLAVASAGSARFDLMGSGDVHAGAIGGGLAATTSGSGDVISASADGPFSARTMGSGDIRVRQGRASSVSATTMGSGDISFGGSATSLEATIMGSGDIHVGQVAGPVRQQVHGSGDVSIGS